MQLSVQMAAMGAAAFLMVKSALHSRLLDRTRSGICPSCGRQRTRGVCDFCTRDARS
jgi:hypothetical protein